MWRNDARGRAVLMALEKKIRQTPSIQVTIEKDAFGSRIYNLARYISLGNTPGDIFSSTYGLTFLRTYKSNVHFSYIGSRSLFFFKYLKEIDHSKVLVFDHLTPNAKAMIGGMNLADEYLTDPNHEDPDLGGWHDYMVLLRGMPVQQLLPEPQKKSKKQNWFFRSLRQGLEVLVHVGGRRRFRHTVLAELSRAKETVVIEHGYITDDPVIRKIQSLAQNGVRVQVILPDRSDGFFHANIASVRKLLKPSPSFPDKNKFLTVFLYRGMIHGKVMVIDQQTAIVGSANLTRLSFNLLQETNAIFRSTSGIVTRLVDQLSADLANCEALTWETIPRFNPVRAFFERMVI